MGMGEQKADCTNENPSTVMNQGCGTNDSGNDMPTNVTSCDDTQVNNEPAYPAPPPPSNSCNADSDCPTSYTCGKGTCVYNPTGGDGGGGGLQCTPIVLAVGSTPDYDLTSIQSGVWFDVTGTGIKQLVAWTQAGQPIGFLVLDRNQNGLIDNRTEMFGNHTLLPNGQLAANGYEALAAYDWPQNGGNGNGVIDAGDAIWPQLQLWIDWNHNGTSEPSELYLLDDFGITQLSLRYEITNRTDQFGNALRLQAPFTVDGKVRMGYDVFFVW